MNQNTVQHDPRPSADDEIDLRQLFRQIWQGKKTVLVSGFLAAMCAVGLAYLSIEYVSVGLLQTNFNDVSKDKDKDKDKDKETVGLSAYNYGKYAEILSNKHNYSNYLDRRADVSGETMALLRRHGAKPGFLQNMFSPVFIGSEKEQRSWGVKLDPLQVGQLFGLKITIAAKAPNNGEAISVLEDYVRDTISQIAFGEYFPKMCERYQKRILGLQANIVSTKFDIRQEEERIILLKPLAASSLQNGAEIARQVVSVDGESKNFLSPRVHVSASEVKVAGLRLQNERNEMLVQEAHVMTQFYCAADAERNKWSGVDHFFEQLNVIILKSFDGRKIDPDLALRLESEMRLDISSLKDGFQRKMRFAQPAAQLELKVKKVGFAIAGLLGGVFGLFIGCAVVLLRHWWCSSQPSIEC